MTPWGWAPPKGATLPDAAPFCCPGGLSCALGSQRPLRLSRGTSVLKVGVEVWGGGAAPLTKEASWDVGRKLRA